MIIDFHTHIFPSTICQNRKNYFPSEPAFELLYQSSKSRLIGAIELLDAMDENEVERVGVGLNKGDAGIVIYDDKGQYVRGMIRQKNGVHYTSHMDENGKEVIFFQAKDSWRMNNNNRKCN